MIREGLHLIFPDQPSKGDRLHVREALRQETTGGVLMLLAAVIAVAWANLFPVGYEHLQHLHIGPLALSHWASDGLLTIFFFVAGLELKRELTEGALRKPQRAALPAAAAVAGMVVPALLYLGVNAVAPGGDTRGWAVGVATDIAFALAVLAIVGRSLPEHVRSFLLTLAIVDDLGAIVIIAVAFTATVAWLPLVGAIALCVGWWLLQRRRLTAWWIYVPIAVATWALTLASGIHATIAGVALGLLTYCSADDDHDVLDRWEHALRPVSAGIVVPVFALLSAGVHVTGATLSRATGSPVFWGIVAALVVGKLIGCFMGAFGAAKATGTHLRADLGWADMTAAAQLAGIGFTVSLLMAELSFPGETATQQLAKSAVLTASILAALAGGALIHRRARLYRRRHLD